MTIIFDLDGTLLNTIDDLGHACNHALEACGFPTHPIEEYPRLVGNGVNKLIERALPEGEKTEETVLRVREFFVPYYDAHNCDYTHPYDGIPELLAALQSQGHHLAVASNKYQAATEKIVAHFFPGIFDIVLGERTGIPRKPDPQIVKDILSTFNIQHYISATASSIVTPPPMPACPLSPVPGASSRARPSSPPPVPASSTNPPTCSHSYKTSVPGQCHCPLISPIQSFHHWSKGHA